MIKINKNKLVKIGSSINKWIREYLVERQGIVIILPVLVITIGLFVVFNPINMRLRRSLDKDYLYQASSNDITVSLGSRGTGRPTVKAEVGETSIIFTYQDSVETKTKPIKKGNTLLFKDVVPNADLTYQTIPNGVKEELILKSAPDSHFFIFQTEIEGMGSPKVVTTDTLQPVIYDENGNYLFHFEKPFAYDASGARTDNAIIQLRPSPTNPNYFKTIVAVDKSWLFSPDRVYPITIDPTIVHDTSDEFATGTLNRAKDTGATSFPSIETWYQELAADEYTLGLWHMNHGADNSCSGGQDACDSSGNGYHGTFNGNAAFTGSGIIGTNSTTFDGTGDFIALGDPDIVDSFMTIEAWIRPTTITGGFDAIYSKETLSLYNNAGDLFLYIGGDQLSPDDVLIINEWQHVAATIDEATNTLILYLNGKEIARNSAWTGTIPTGSNNAYIGRYSAVNQEYFQGQIDEVRISDNIRTPEEIKLAASRRPYSIYTSAAIDLYEEVLDFDELNWNELGVATGDGETVFSSTNLVAQWNFNETSGTTANNDAEGTSCGGTPANCDGTLTSFDSTASQDADPDSSWTANNRRWGAGALQFDGIDSNVSCTDANCGGSTKLDPSGSLTVSAWIKTSVAHAGTIASKMDSGGVNGWAISVQTTGKLKFWTYGSTNFGRRDSLTTVTDGNWHHVVGVYDATSDTNVIYVDGKLDNGTLTSTVPDTIDDSADNFTIGYGLAGLGYFKGAIDSVQVYSSALSQNEILSLYNTANIEFQTRVGPDTSPDDGNWDAWSPTSGETQIQSFNSDYTNWFWDNLTTYTPEALSNDSVTFLEGSASMKLAIGAQPTDASTIASWHIDETNGDNAGVDIFDATSNSLDLEINGSTLATSVVDGLSGKARDFDGTSDYLSIADNSLLDFTTTDSFTLSIWFKTSDNAAAQVLLAKRSFTGTTPEEGYYIRTRANDGAEFGIEQADNTTTEAGGTGTKVIDDGEWHHIVAVRNVATDLLYYYVDGDLIDTSTDTTTATLANTNSFYVGRSDSSSPDYFDGIIDEVSVHNVARDAEWVEEAYRMGRDHYLNRTLSSTDLSAKGKLAFNIASDRPGTFLEMTIGESGTAVASPSANYVGYWKMDEMYNNSCDTGIDDTCDTTGLGNDLDNVGTGHLHVTGKIGLARDFDGSSNSLTRADDADFDFAETDDFTLGAWVKHDGAIATNPDYIITKMGSAAGGYKLYMDASGDLCFGVDDDSTFDPDDSACTSAIDYDDSQWHHVVGVKDGTTAIYLYIDGVLVASDTSIAATGTLVNANAFRIGVDRDGTSNEWDGVIDEAFVTREMLSAADIRQMVERDLRTHPITIDFGAKLTTTDLITGSTDTSFQIDETAYGATDKSEHLFNGDKIIVRETVDDTTYIAQGTVISTQKSSGDTRVVSWDSASTFPSAGFTANASVFKWQTEYFDINNITLDSHLDAITAVTLRVTNGSEGRNIWLDDLRSVGDYLTTPAGSTITSDVGERYLQYRTILSSSDEAVSATVSAVTVDYQSGAAAAHWKFDEGASNTCSGGTNDTCDSSINSNDGAITGATWQPRHMCANGVCLYFDGSDDVVTVTSSDDISLSGQLASGFTIAAWAKPNSDGEGSVGEIWNKGTNNYARITNEGADGFADLEVKVDLATTDATVTITNGITLDTFNHVAIAYTDDGDDEVSVYINGNLRGTSTDGDGAPATDANNLLIGGSTGANFHGFIDDFKMFEVEKTEAEIKTLYIKDASTQGSSVSFDDPLTDGLTAYWPMDEAAADSCTGGVNDNCDKSGNGFDLAWANQTTATVGKYGNGTTYDGTGDNATCTDANCGGTSNLDFGAGDQFSFGGWFKNTSTSTDIYFGKKNSLAAGTAGYIMQQTTSDTVRCIVADGTNIVQPVSTSTYNDGNWHHAFCTTSKDYVSLYVDGVLVDQDANTLTATLDNTDSFVVAESGAGTGDLTGQIDDLRVYRRSLSEKEVDSLYNWGPSPIGYWPMDENTGTSTTYDKSGNGFNGTLTSVAETSWMPGKYGSALNFDGSADYATITDNNTLDVTAGITISGWAKFDSTPDPTASVLRKESAYIGLQKVTSNLRCVLWPGAVSTTVNYVPLSDIDATNWHHYSCTYNGATIKTYVDGVLTNSTAASGTLQTSAHPFCIGAKCEDTPGEFADVNVDEVKIYSYARTAAQVTEDMNAGHPIGGSPTASQIIRYKFDEGNSSNTYNHMSLGSGIGKNPGTSSLISWWTLGDTTGNSTDAHSSNDLTETGGTIASTTGKVDKSRDFELIDTEYFLIADNTSLSMGDIPFTIGAWVNTESQAGIMQILSKFNSTGNTREYRVYYNNSTDRFEFNVTPSGTTTGEATATADNYGAVPGSTWAFVVAYHDPTANTIGISVDAGTVNTTSYSAGVYDGTADFTIGAGAFPEQYFDGLIDEAFVYKKVLTQEEINWLYNTTLGRSYAALDVNGIISGATWKNGSDCKISGCLDFDGSDDVVTTTNSPQIDFDTALSTGVTFTAWINADSDGEGDVGEIFDKGATTYCRTDSQGTTDLDLECSLDLGTTDATVNITDGLTTDTWHHIAMIYNNDSDDEIEVYIDGLLRGTSTNGDGAPATSDTNDLLIGGSTGANFDGTIDEFHLYNVPLTLEQVLIDRNANSQASLGGVLGATEKSTLVDGAGTNPTGWWKLDENTGTTSTYDSSGNSFTGTLTSITASSWVPGKLGSALNLDGSADFIDIGTGPSSVKTVTFWVYPETTTEYFVNLTSTTDYIWVNSGTVTATGFSSPTIYVDGVATTTLVAGSWQHVAVVTDTAENASNMDIGRTADANYLQGKIDEVKMYDYALTKAQVAYEFNRGRPVGWWRMDEGTGTTTTYDASGKGYNLTMNTMAEADWVTGKYGTALDFDGSSDYLSCTDASCGGTTKLDFGVSPAFSYGAWYKTTATGVQQRIIGKKTNAAGSAGYMLNTRTTDSPRCKISDGTNVSDVQGTIAINDGTWHHVMCVHTGSALHMYVDGILQLSDSDTTDVTGSLDNTSDFRIGVEGGGTNFFTGQIDDGRVYNYALSQKQVREIMNYGAQRFGN